MRALIKINNKDYVLDSEQMHTLLGLLTSTAYVKDEYVGCSKGDNGTNYKKLLRRADADEGIDFKLLTDDYVDTLALKTKLHDEDASSK
jgi:hypothetical protein